MGLPPNVKSILPSLRVEDERIATLAIADIKRQLPSLRIANDRQDVTDVVTITLSIEDLRKLLRVALAGVEVDEKWYLTQVPGLSKAIEESAFGSPAEHFRVHGYLEGRLPKKPTVDEEHYCLAYPDVAQAIQSGRLRSAYEHYIRSGNAEGRSPTPPPANRNNRQLTPIAEPVPDRRANLNGSKRLQGNAQRRRERDGCGLHQPSDQISLAGHGSRLSSNGSGSAGAGSS